MRTLLALLLACTLALAEDCPSCGADTGDNANFCPKCGASLAGAGQAVDDAARAAEESKKEFLASLEALRRAYEEAGQTARAADMESLIRMLEESKLGPDGRAGGPVTVKAPGKSIKEANDLFEQAKLYMSTVNPVRRRTNLNVAIDKLNDLIAKYPESDKVVDSWYNLGLLYQDGLVKRYEDSIKAYDKVKELDSENSSDSRLRAAQIVDNLGRWQEAYDRYDDVIRHDANSRNVEWAKRRRVQLEPYVK